MTAAARTHGLKATAGLVRRAAVLALALMLGACANGPFWGEKRKRPPEEPPPVLIPMYELDIDAPTAAQRKLLSRYLDLARFQDELRTLYDLSRRIFARNFLYTEIPADEFFQLYAAARPLLDPELVVFARSAAGPRKADVGFLFAYPDHQAGRFHPGDHARHRRLGQPQRRPETEHVRRLPVQDEQQPRLLHRQPEIGADPLVLLGHRGGRPDQRRPRREHLRPGHRPPFLSPVRSHHPSSGTMGPA